jgi:uncharacterized protein
MSKEYELRREMVVQAYLHIQPDDPSHDIYHALRVLGNAEHISHNEGGDLEIIIPAALFHDSVNHKKGSRLAKYSADQSAYLARTVLEKINYPSRKIHLVEKAIKQHSFSTHVVPDTIEGKIVQDADRLEATGALGIMRTFCSSGVMSMQFYNPDNKFCKDRQPDCMKYALDLFYTRLLKVADTLNTATAKKMAAKRVEFLKIFLDQLKDETSEVKDYYFLLYFDRERD